MRGRLSRPNRIVRKAVPWYERDGGLRLAHDQELLRIRYPQLSFSMDQETQRMRVQGSLVYVLACGIPTEIVVRISFPTDYPRHEPSAYDGGAQFPYEADRHFHPSGQCCLWLPPESQWDAEDPNALGIFLDQVAVFFDRQLICNALPAYEASQWPGGARDHGVAGYLEYVRDAFGGDEGLVTALLPSVAGGKRVGRNQTCPCGSSVKYKWCHLSQVENTRRSLAPAERDLLLKASGRTSSR